jgi:hypothetical protein
MKRRIIALLGLAACGPTSPPEHYGFITRLGRDTISVESVTRRGNQVTVDGTDRFPRVRQRHTEITLRPDGGIRRLVMDIHTPSEPTNQRDRRVVADVTDNAIHVSKRDKSGAVERDFKTGGVTAMAHVPQMYSLYELFFAAALDRATKQPGAGDTVRFRQFYIDREFDRFSLHGGTVKRLADNKAEIWHDWLAGIGEATLDSAHHLLRYSGARTTYKVDVERVGDVPDVRAIGARFTAAEAGNGGVTQLSVRDTARATIGGTTFTVDYSRPLVRGRQLLGDVVPYDRLWRTGANAATQFTTSSPITLAGIQVPAGTYTLWTVPHANGTHLIVNKQTGQWGTSYDGTQDLGRANIVTETATTPVERFTISIVPKDSHQGTLTMAWGTFRWTAPIVVLDASPAHR